MKQNITLFLLFISQCFCFSVLAQDSMRYTYDAAGNRISRIYVPLRSFTPFSQDVDEKKSDGGLIETKVNIYPNPVQSELVVAISELPEKGSWQVLLYDMAGKMIYQKEQESMQAVIPMADYLPGGYIVKLIVEQSQSVWKIIKK